MHKHILIAALAMTIQACETTTASKPKPQIEPNAVKAPDNMAADANNMIITPDGRLVFKP